MLKSYILLSGLRNFVDQYYHDGTLGVLIGGETPHRNSPPIGEASPGILGKHMAEDPPPQPRTRDDAGDKTPAQAVDEAIEDTPVPMSTKKAAELKFSGSVDASSSSTSLSIGTGHNHSTDGLSFGLGQNQDNPDSREVTSDTISQLFHSTQISAL
jgi:hypothetical protein